MAFSTYAPNSGFVGFRDRSLDGVVDVLVAELELLNCYRWGGRGRTSLRKCRSELDGLLSTRCCRSWCCS